MVKTMQKKCEMAMVYSPYRPNWKGPHRLVSPLRLAFVSHNSYPMSDYTRVVVAKKYPKFHHRKTLQNERF